MKIKNPIRVLVLSILLIISTFSLAQERADELLFSHESGFYEWNFVLKVTSKNGNTIRYTNDGSIPTQNSMIFTDSIPITILSYLPDKLVQIKTSPRNTNGHTDKCKANIIRIASFKEEERTSLIYNQSYFVGISKKDKYPSVPVISLITDPNNFFDYDTGIYAPGIHYKKSNNNGNYYQKGMQWERPSHLQFFDSTGLLQFEQDIGIRIQGKIRRIPQKSLRICARKEYGNATMEYPFFGPENTSSFKKLVLRNSMGCWQKTLFKDQLTSYICQDLNFESSLGQPVIIFLNGEYWGIHAIREYFNDDHLSKKFGIPKDSVNIVKHDYGHSKSSNNKRNIEEGSGNSLIKMYRFLNKNNLDVPSNYAALNEQLDIQSVIDYYCAEIFFDNHDWPGNNNILWSEGMHGKWRQAFYDLDAGWNNVKRNTLGFLLNNPDGRLPLAAKYLFQKLMESETFKTDFSSRMKSLLANEFSEANILSAIDSFEKIYDPLIQDHIYRWEIPGSINQWKGKIANLKSFAKNRPTQILIDFKAVFGSDFKIGESEN